jgi:hypothetical protein
MAFQRPGQAGPSSCINNTVVTDNRTNPDASDGMGKSIGNHGWLFWQIRWTEASGKIRSLFMPSARFGSGP